LKTKELLALGMNLLHGVGKSAVVEPRCMVVRYKGNPDSEENDIALAGKGVTYDTGGLNLKATGFIEDMYGDKGGACAVIGALHGVLELKPKKNIVFSVGLAENSIDSISLKPMDIVKSMKGLTIEIGNTDAEGRLVLCDVFTYVQQEFKPKMLIDLATLTGACMVALGPYTAGIFDNNEEMAADIKKSGAAVFESFWRLPILDDHRESLNRASCDMNNIGTTRPYGGASVAAAYLREFVDKDVKLCHLDIAGPSNQKAATAPVNVGQTGFATQTLLQYICHVHESTSTKKVVKKNDQKAAPKMVKKKIAKKALKVKTKK
jgi:leucyl aminopeptidase